MSIVCLIDFIGTENPSIIGESEGMEIAKPQRNCKVNINHLVCLFGKFLMAILGKGGTRRLSRLMEIRSIILEARKFLSRPT